MFLKEYIRRIIGRERFQSFLLWLHDIRIVLGILFLGRQLWWEPPKIAKKDERYGSGQCVFYGMALIFAREGAMLMAEHGNACGLMELGYRAAPCYHSGPGNPSYCPWPDAVKGILLFNELDARMQEDWMDREEAVPVIVSSAAFDHEEVPLTRWRDYLNGTEHRIHEVVKGNRTLVASIYLKTPPSERHRAHLAA